MRVKVYFCKYCGHKEIIKDPKMDRSNFCPKCLHYMSDQEWDIDDLNDFTIEKKGEEDGRR